MMHSEEEQEPVASTSSDTRHSADATRQGGEIGLPVVEVSGHLTEAFYLLEILRAQQLQTSAFKITHCRRFSDDKFQQYNWVEYRDYLDIYGQSCEEPPEYQSFKSILELGFKDFIYDESLKKWIAPEGVAAAPEDQQAIEELCTEQQWECFYRLFRGFLQGLTSRCGCFTIHALLQLLKEFITIKREHLILAENIGGGSSAKRSLIFNIKPYAVAIAATQQKTNTKKRRRTQRYSTDQMSTGPVVSKTPKSKTSKPQQYNTKAQCSSEYTDEMSTAPVVSETTAPKSQHYNTRAQCSSDDEMSTASTAPIVSETTLTTTTPHQYNTGRKSSDSTDYSSLSDGSVNMSKSGRRVIKKDYVPDVVLLVRPKHIPTEIVEDNVLLTVSVKHGCPANLNDSVINQLLHEMFPVLMKFNVALGLIISATQAKLIRLVNNNGIIRTHKTSYHFYQPPRFDDKQFSMMCVDIIQNCQKIYNDVF